MNRKLRRFLFFLGFQPDGQPKTWLRYLLLRDQKTGLPRKFAERIVFKKSGSIRPVLADWYERYVGNENSAEFAPYLNFIRGQIARGHLGRARSLHIVSTQHTEIVAESLAECLATTRLIVTRSTSMPESFTHDLYLVVAPQMFDRMPPPERTLMMQMEQVKASPWVTPDYLRRLNGSLAILDYSTDNIESLVRRGIPVRQTFHVPLLPFRIDAEKMNERDIDILFYGAMSSHRREAYVEALSRRFNVRVETNLFGEDLRRLLSRSKIVVNIHFYEDALLETTRILESVRFGAKVVSETARDQADYGSLSPLVAFVPRGDIAGFLDEVDRQLSSWGENAPVLVGNDFGGMRYHVLRAFNAIGILDFDELMSELTGFELPSDRLVLALPEYRDRYNYATQGLLPKAKVFHGLRHVDGWKGCALSYKLIATLALRAKIYQVLIYEDDAELPSDILERTGVVEEYLSETEGRWDVFSGLVSDVRKDAKVFEVSRRRDEIFVHTDAFVGMVFCIYGKGMLEWISEYEFTGEDILKNTIDRYLEAKHPRCVTVLKPLVGHAEDFSSSIWSNKNAHSLSMISASANRLEEIVQKHESG